MGQDLPSRLLAVLVVLGTVLCVIPPAWAGVNWWTPIGPEGGSIFDVEIDPFTGAVYAGTGGSVFVSTNGGGSWERRSRGLEGGMATQLEVSAVAPGALYAAANLGVYRSVNGGLSWTLRAQLPNGVSSLAVDPSDAAVLYAGTPFDRILKSTDGGASWIQVFETPSCGAIQSLAIDPRDPSRIYASCSALTPTAVYKSADGGATWAPAAVFHPEAQSSFLVLDPDHSGVLYVSSFVPLDNSFERVWTTFKSVDGGASWTRFGPLGEIILPSPPGLLFLGRYRSTDGGSTWQELPLPAAPSSLAFAPDAPATLYAGILPFGVYKSTDAGATWTPVNRGLYATSIKTLEISRESTLHALVQLLGLRKKPEGANRWRRADDGLPIGHFFVEGKRPLAIDPQDPAKLYYGDVSGLFHSSDGGASWTSLNECIVGNYLAIDPQDTDRLYAAGFSEPCSGLPSRCAVFRSSDAGATWSCIAPPAFQLSVYGLVVDPVEPSRLYILRQPQDEIWVSTDRGDRWRKLNLPLQATQLTALAVDPTDSRRLYVGTLWGRLFKSSNRGATWSALSRGLPAEGPEATIRDIVVDPQRPQTVYVVNASGVFITGNGGRTWFPLNGGLPDAPLRLVLDPQNPRKLYAATDRNGVYAHERR